MIVAGFGFRAAATGASLEDALARAGGGVKAGATVFATAADKAVSPVMVAFGDACGVRVEGIPAEVLTAQLTVTTSNTSLSARATGSVAEAAALAAAGRGAIILAPRVVSADRMATCALARRIPEGEDR